MNKETIKIRPVFVTYPSIYSLLMLNYFIGKAKIKFAGIILSDSHIKVKGKNPAIIPAVFNLIKKSGLIYSLYMLFAAKFAYILLTFWNIVSGLSGKSLNLKTFWKIAEENKIPLFKSRNVNDQRTIGFMKNIDANIIVSGYNNQILKYSTTSKFSLGAINIHNSYLPDFGGLDAAFEALYEGVEETGATIHYIDKGIDTGRIIMQKKISVYHDDSIFSLNIRQWLSGAKMLPEVLNLFNNGIINETEEQNPSKTKYPYKSFPEQKRVKEFIQRSKQCIRLRDIFIPNPYLYELFNTK